jgi:hypothetical protein
VAARAASAAAEMERQIGEFYSPILGLVEQYLVVDDVKKEILERSPGSPVAEP